MNRLICFLLIALLVVGCGAQGTVIITATPPSSPDKPSETMVWPTNTSIPTQEFACTGLPGVGFLIINDNPCLLGPMMTLAEDGITQQYRPERHVLISRPGNADGYEDDYSGHAPIAYNDGYVFDISTLTGEWGFELPPMRLAAGCHILKASGEGDIDDLLRHDSNYYIGGYLRINGVQGEQQLDGRAIPFDNEFEMVWPFEVGVPSSVIATVTVIAGWGDAQKGSTVTLNTISVSKAPDGYCLGDVPGI